MKYHILRLLHIIHVVISLLYNIKNVFILYPVHDMPLSGTGRRPTKSDNHEIELH